MSDRTLGKARGLNSIADPKAFKGSNGRDRLGLPTPPPAPVPVARPEPRPVRAPLADEPRLPEPDDTERDAAELEPAAEELSEAAAAPDETGAVTELTVVPVPAALLPPEASPAMEPAIGEPPAAALSPQQQLTPPPAGPPAFETPPPPPPEMHPSAEPAVLPLPAPAPPAPSDPHAVPAANGYRPALPTPAVLPPGLALAPATPVGAGAPAGPLAAPGANRKRRELTVPTVLAEALDRTGINPADVVMAGYRRHSEAIYAGYGGRMMARGRTRLRLSISDSEFEQITRLGEARGWNRSETVAVILALELLTPGTLPGG